MFKSTFKYLFSTLLLTCVCGVTWADDGDVIFHETFDNATGTGGNDGKWSGNIASSNYSLTGWTFTNPYGADRCIRLGAGSKVGGAITPSISFTNGKTYTLIFRAGAWSGGATLKVSIGSTTIVSSLTLEDSKFATYTYTLNPTGASTITIETTGKKRFFLDDVMIVEGSKVKVEISASGYSSFVAFAGLDFSNATPSGLTAYVASEASSSSITLTAVEEAPATTALILKGSENQSYLIPIKTTAADIESDNLLKAATSATNIAAGDYVLYNGKFCAVNAAGTIAAGKAYLESADVPAAARELTFDFSDATAIGAVANSEEVISNGEFYDLQGRRVTNPTKGIYIVNGKKVVIK